MPPASCSLPCGSQLGVNSLCFSSGGSLWISTGVSRTPGAWKTLGTVREQNDLNERRKWGDRHTGEEGTEEPESDNETRHSTGRACPLHGFHLCHWLSRVWLLPSIKWVKGVKGTQTRGGHEPSRRHSPGLPQETVWQGGRKRMPFSPAPRQPAFSVKSHEQGRGSRQAWGKFSRTYSSFLFTHKRRGLFYLKEKLYIIKAGAGSISSGARSQEPLSAPAPPRPRSPAPPPL